jgi:hypothetical protein
MKAQSLWSGHDYAYSDYRGRNQTRYSNIQRVKVISWVKRKPIGYKNEKTYVRVQFLDWDGNETDTTEREVRAYDIVDFWEDYWAENGEWHLEQKAFREEQERKRKEDEERWRRLREEREAEEARKREEIQHKRNRIKRELHNKGLQFNDDELAYGNVILSSDGNSVTIRGDELKRWLGLLNTEASNVLHL